MTSNPESLPPRSPAPRGVAPIPSSAAGPARRFRLPRALRVSLPLAVVAVGAGLLAPAGRLAWGQGGGDTNPPVIHLLEGGSEITEGRRFKRPAQPVIEVTDESSVTVEATVDGAPFAAGGTVTGEGTHQLAVTATDASGNAASLQVGFEIDTVPPSFLSLDPPDGSFAATATVTLSGQVEGATAVTVDGQAATLNGQSFAAGPYTLAAGPRTFALAAADAAGNRVERTLRVIRDSTAPTVSIGQPAAGALVKEGTVDVSGTVADTNLAGVTVNGVAATVTGQTFLAQQVPLAEGSNSVVARAIDRAGTAAEAARTVVRDSEPPAVEITDPAAGTIVPGTSVTLRGTATDAHLDRVEVNGARAQLAGNVWSYTASLASGANSFNVRAFDRLGSSAPAAISVERDSEAPAVQIEQPAVGTRLPASTVSVSGTVDDEPGLTLTVNGAAATVTAGQWSISGVALLEGENTLTARARDAQGNEGVHTRLVVRDSVAPRLLRSDPASGALAIPGGTVFRLTFSEPLAAPAAADVRLETGSGQAIAATLTAAGDDLTLAPSASLPSATQVRVVLTAGLHDLAGNALAGAPATLTFFTADTAAPAAPVLAPAPPVALCAASLPLAGSAEAGAVVRVEGGAAAAESRADEQGHFSLSVTLVPETGNRLRLTAIDSGGNPSLSLVVEVIHDCLPPHVLAAERQGGGFRIGFSEGIAASSLSGSVQLASAEGAIAGSTALGAGGRTATFTPAAALPAVPLRLEVTAGVRDHAGNALAYPFSQVFGAQGGTGFVTGTVIDDATGRPLAGARVLVYATHGAPLPEPRPEQVTGPDGRFRLPASAATHDLTIARPGYTPAFRVVTVAAGRGTDLLDPRLTPIGASGSVPTSGGMLEAGDGGARWTLPANALAQETNVAVTGLSEQGLPTLLPYGWSPRGAAWLSLGGAALLAPAELSLPAEGGDGAVLTWVHLDLATLQWRVMGTAEVAGGRVEMEVPASAAGLAEGAYAAVEADAPQDPALAPPSPVLGAVLPAAPRPTGNEPTAASLTFSPEVVLPTQSSRATALFTLWEEAASGLALTLSIVEELTLADGSVRREAPYSADLVLYHAPGGAARSRFDLRPSGAAQSLPLHLGAENVTLRTYGGEAVAGNVVGPEGGTVTDDEGDRIDLPAGAVADPTAVGLGRHAGTSLGAAIPAGTELAGALDLDLGGVNLLVPASLSLALSPAPAAGEKGFLLQLVDLDGTPVFRPVAELQATGEGWTTSSITAADLPWPGVTEGGTYAFVRRTAPFGFARGEVSDVGGAALAGALVLSDTVSWIQLSDPLGRYVLPLAMGTATVTAENRTTGNRGSGSAEITAAEERVDLDLTLQPVGPRVVSTTPSDGASDVLAGIEPTIRFSEPVDPASLAAGVLLKRDGQLVAVTVSLVAGGGGSGSLVRVEPRSALEGATAYELWVTGAILDLQGNPLSSSEVVHFTTRRILLPDDLDLAQVFLIEPDAAGMARVLGRPGAVPSGTTVFAENLTSSAATTTVDAGQAGGFDLPVEASLSDRIVLHVLIPGSNEVAVELTPFHTPDLRGAYVGAQALTFRTGDGYEVKVQAGTFDGPTRLRVEPSAPSDSPVLARDAFAKVAAFRLDFGGAEARKALGLRIPLPAGSPVPVGGFYLLNRKVEVMGDDAWMMHDLLRQDGPGFLTTDPPPTTAAAFPEAVTRIASLGDAFEVAFQGTESPQPIFAADVYIPKHKRYVPGAAFPGEYQIEAPTIPLGFVAFPSFPMNALVGIWNLGLEGMITVMNAAIERLLEGDGVLLPARLDRPVKLVVRDLETGYRLFDGSFAAPTGPDLVVLPRDILGDRTPPFPAGGSPLRFLPFNLGADGDIELLHDVTAERGAETPNSGSTLSIAGKAGSTLPGTYIRLLSLDPEGPSTQEARSDENGAFQIALAPTKGSRFLLALGGKIEPADTLVLAFSEALGQDLSPIELRDAAGRPLAPRIEPVGSRETFTVRPEGGWRAGETYTLTFGSGLADDAGNRWQKTLSLKFEVSKSREIGTFALDAVRDVARLGSWLFVAAEDKGLYVLDASNPAQLTNVLAGSNSFPFPLADPVRGVAVDPHGRVLVVGGGVRGFGQLKIFDALALTPEAITAINNAPTSAEALSAPFAGSTIVSDMLGGVGTQLPSGTPRKVTVLSNDDKDEWRVGEDAPNGLTVLNLAQSPDGSRRVRVSGSNGTAKHPVSFFDLTLGRWTRVDADAQGSFEIELESRTGDRVRLLRNRQSLAYVATQGVGLEVVDLDKVYRTPPRLSPIAPSPASDVIGIYSGYQDPELKLCGQHESDLGSVLVDLDSLFASDNPHPLAVVGLAGARGLVLLESNQSNAGLVTFLNEMCADSEGSTAASGLDVVQGYRFDFDHDGELEESEERDYAVVSHRIAGLLVYDVTDRENVVLVGKVKVPGTASQVSVDVEHRVAYVSGGAAGLFVVDFDRLPSVDPLDRNSDNVDDRVLETITLTGTTNSPSWVIPELGIALAGGLRRGLTSLSVTEPLLRAVVPKPNGKLRTIDRLAPFGVPTAKETADPESPDLPGAFVVEAHLPGSLGAEVRLDLLGVGPGGQEIRGLALSEESEVPQAKYTGDKGLVLKRLSGHPYDAGYSIYRSKEVAALADPRAARHYTRTQKEKDVCKRCDLDDLHVEEEAVELLSGEGIAVRYPAELRTRLAATYDRARLDAAELSLQSVRWDTVPALRQEPRQSPSFGRGEAVPGTVLSSGEMSLSAADLVLKGRGIDFAFTRSYRSQTLGSGPLGPGWDFGYRLRLRELPNGDVEQFDGRGRRELWEKQEDGKLKAPKGLFATLSRTAAGWVLLDAGHNVYRFDRYGRWTSLADSIKDSEATGNEMLFGYDVAGRLVTVTDPLDRVARLTYDDKGRLKSLKDSAGREVQYAYDGEGRLEKVTSPKVTSGLKEPSAGAEGLVTRYGYDTPTGDLAARLANRDNLKSLTDPRGVELFDLTYTDADQNGRADEVTAQQWGVGQVGLAYDFEGRTTFVTDRRGAMWKTDHDEDGHPTRLEDPSGAVTTATYDEEGLPDTITAPLGRTTKLTYEEGDARRSRGNVKQTTITADSRGNNGSAAARSTQAEYEGRSNQPIRMVDGRGTVTSISRDDVGQPKSLTEGVGSEVAATSQFEWNDHGQPERVTNANGHARTFRYTGSGEKKGYLESVTVDPDGLALVTRFEVDSRGNPTAVIDPRQVRHERTYNELDWLVSATEPLGLRFETRYDPAGQPVEELSPAGGSGQLALRRTFGDLGEILTVSREIGSGGAVATESTVYDANLNPTEHTRSEGQKTSWTYDSRNLPTQVVHGADSPVAVLETLEYDLEGQLTSRTDGRGAVWTTAYDGFSRPKESADPLGLKAQVAYDDGDQPIERLRLDAGESLMARSAWTYDARGRLSRAKADLWSAEQAERTVERQTTYDAVGNVLSVTDPMGRVTQQAYDGAERLRQLIDPAGNQIEWTRDGQGNPTQKTTTERVDGGAGVTTSEAAVYDDLGRKLSVVDALGNTQSFLYDARGNVVLATDAEGNSTSATYDGFDRMLQSVQPEGIVIEYDYDTSGRLLSYQDAKDQETRWTYDALDRITSITYPDQTTRTTVYDLQSNPIETLDPMGTRITRTFDLGGRMTARTALPGAGVETTGAAESFSYDGLSRLTQAQSGDQVTARTYDSLSRMTSETHNGKTLRWSLDDAGNAVGTTYPDGYRVDATYDNLDLPKSIRNGTEPLAEYGWRGAGLPIQKNLGNGLTGSASYDLAGRMTDQSFRTPQGLTAFGETLGWNPRGLQTSSSRTDLNGAGWSRAYDGASRLVQAASSKAAPDANAPKDPLTLAGFPTSFGYRYDGAQNLLERTAKKDDGKEEKSPMPLDGSGRNRPASVHGVPLEWDANGNLTRKGNRHFHYDAWNRLSRVSNEAGLTIASYKYDVFNRRTSRTVGNRTQATIWDGWQPVEEYVDNQILARRVYGAGIDEVVSVATDVTGVGGTLSLPLVPLYDLTGNVTALTGANGKPIERYEYSPYGEVTVTVDSTPPAVQQLRVKGAALWLEISEEVSKEALDQAVASHGLILEDATTHDALAFTLSQPVQEGRLARRRVALTLAAPPAADTQVRLVIPAEALHDLFLNHPQQAFERTFPWPAADAVLFDETAPQLNRIGIKQGVLQVTFTEEPDTASLQALEIDGNPATWTLAEDRYTVVAGAPLAAGSHTLEVAAGVTDLASHAIATSWSETVQVVAQDTKALFEVPDPRIIPGSTIGNPFAFQGLPKDAESGLVYVRNRYYDPELGRFVTVDPLLYVDGPNPYGFAGNDPVNGSDPSGLIIPPPRPCLEHPEVCNGILDEAIDFLKGLPTLPCRIWKQDSEEHLAKAQAYARGGYEEYHRVALEAHEEHKKMAPIVASGQNLGEAYEAYLNGTDYEFGRKLTRAGISVAGDIALVDGVATKSLSLARVGARELAPGVEGLALRGGILAEVDPRSLRWSQTTAGRGRSVARRAAMIENQGWVGPPADVVLTRDGLATLDHTGPALAIELGFEKIPVRIHLPGDPLPLEMLNRPWNKYGETATTWGEALAKRGEGQTPLIGPTGRPKPPKILK